MAKLGKALMSLLLDKKAREALEAKAAAPRPATQHVPQTPPQQPGQAAPAQAPHPSQEEIYARLDEAQQASTNRANTPDRQRLIQEALKVRANKAKMLEELPEEQRRRLQAMAMMSFMKSRPEG